MKKQLLNLVIISIFLSTFVQAEENAYKIQHSNFNRQHCHICNILGDERLKLREEQKIQIYKNRQETREKVSTIIKQMEEIRDKINLEYESKKPKWQIELVVSKYKTELVKMKQEIDKIRQENRNKFQKILDEEQRVQFEIIKKEYKSQNR